MIIKKIAISSILTALLVAIKYALGFLPGVELTTFLVISYALFLPLSISSLTIVSSIFIIGIIYGFGTWWIMYWIIFPAEALLTFTLRKYLKKNNIVFALWTGFWGFSILFWFALYDWVLYDQAKAIMGISTGVVTNTIEGAINLFVALVLFYPIKSVIDNHFDLVFQNQYY